MEKFFELMRSHLELQDCWHLEQLDLQDHRHQEKMRALSALVEKSSAGSAATIGVNSTATPNFSAFDVTSELWQDYLPRFSTFPKAHDVPKSRKRQVFLLNQTATVYKVLANLAAQISPPRRVNDLTMEEIEAFMTDQFNANRFVICERFKFWSEMKRRLGETIQELAARICQDVRTCDFPSITDLLDEALRTRFICSVSNEAVLKALFKVKSDELTFAWAIQIAMETEEAARVAKETVFGTKSELLHKVGRSRKLPGKSTSKDTERHKIPVCYRCGKKGHLSEDCRFKNAVCNFCK